MAPGNVLALAWASLIAQASALTATRGAASSASARASNRAGRMCARLSMPFSEFVEKYNKDYTFDSDEYHRRRKLFEERVQLIDEHNCGETEKPWTAGLNHLTDWSDEELRSLRGYKGQGKARDSLLSKDAYYSSLNSRPTRHAYPESWDWSHIQAIREPRDQGQCGSCWAFASEQVLRAHAEIKGWPSNFSVSQIVSCTPNPHQCGGTGGCQGATVELAFDYALRGGLVREEVLPYPQGGGEAHCPQNLRVRPADQDGILDVDGSEVHLLGTLANPQAARGRHIGMVGWTKFPENKQTQMLRALVEEGPVAVAVAAGHDWNWYVRGIMLPTGCDTKFVISHAVVLFGYGVSNRRQFWRLKNSWGYDWGEGGNLRLQRLSNEESYCGWDNEPEIGSGCKGGPQRVWACGSCGILYDTAMPHFVPFHERESQQALQTPSFYSIREAGAAHPTI